LSTKALYGILSVGIVGVLFAGVAYKQGWLPAPNFDAAASEIVNDETAKKPTQVPDEHQVVGGVLHPPGDLASQEAISPSGDSPSQSGSHGKAIPAMFSFDENEAIAGLVRDMQSGQVPESQTSLILPEEFDKEGYLADPEAYLKQIRPGRVFQSAQPGPDVKRIAAKTRALHCLVHGETTLLEVLVEPGMPVTFYTQQVGEFDNRLSTISVKSGDDGVARAYFKATSAAGMINIIAASPVHSEQVEFAIRVSAPEVVIN